MTPETRDVLCDYLHELRTKNDAGRISERLVDLTPEFESRFRVYAGGLSSATAVIRAQEFGP